MSSGDYELIERMPTPDEHRALAVAVGWDDHFDWTTVPASLAASLHGVVAVSRTGETVAMGRLVGDGIHYFYVQDVVVHPDHESAGLGSSVVELLLEWVSSRVTAQAFVGLFASEEAIGMYREQGFETTDMTGMHRAVGPAGRA
jgi:GNAT superfamily N-acetyltransferase